MSQSLTFEQAKQVVAKNHGYPNWTILKRWQYLPADPVKGLEKYHAEAAEVMAQSMVIFRARHFYEWVNYQVIAGRTSYKLWLDYCRENNFPARIDSEEMPYVPYPMPFDPDQKKPGKDKAELVKMPECPSIDAPVLANQCCPDPAPEVKQVAEGEVTLVYNNGDAVLPVVLTPEQHIMLQIFAKSIGKILLVNRYKVNLISNQK